MKWIKAISYGTVATLTIMFIAFFVYANLEVPTPGEQIYMSNPTGIAMLNVDNNTDPDALAEKVSRLTGVTSHTYVPETHTLVITYSRNQTDRNTVVSGISSAGIAATEKVISSNKPQCPVHKYLDVFYKAKYALNIRK